MACLFVSQQTRKEKRAATGKDSEVKSATMLPRSDEHRTKTSIVMHRDEGVDDRTQQIGLHTSVAGNICGHAVPEVVVQTKNNEGRADVNRSIRDKEGCGMETYQHMLRTAFVEHVFRH